ncbi:hypothetical protein CBOM_07564 [Ceraceosorus bombacis]|uniref:Uncharacterized protein n=1 Tax=Ceraceosorus bombacis TaxID=401625 RepID=A0A0P1BFC3_9BASI|nr:hypothetical protein CBOM_07564 [Ceraceosorus bombacis]
MMTLSESRAERCPPPTPHLRHPLSESRSELTVNAHALENRSFRTLHSSSPRLQTVHHYKSAWEETFNSDAQYCRPGRSL